MPSPGHNTRGEVAYVLEGCALGRHNDIGRQARTQSVYGRAPRWPRSPARSIGYVFQNLSALCHGSGSTRQTGDVSRKRCPIDTDHEVPARPREDYDLIRSILGNAVEGINNLRMGLCRESERLSVMLGSCIDQHAFRILCQLQAA